NPARFLRFAWAQHGGKFATTDEGAQLVEREELGGDAGEALQPMLQLREAAEQSAVVQIKANEPLPVSDEPMFDIAFVDFDGRVGFIGQRMMDPKGSAPSRPRC
ncbi:MAG: hypothetical protein IBJ13_13220, partial [Sphingopyxis sp.]|nr:hypothetical protein [Sphingopyxis sp.]